MVAVPSAVKVTFTEVELALVTVGCAIAVNVVTAVEAAETIEPKPSVVPLVVGVTLYWYAVLGESPVTVQLCVPVGTVVVFATTHEKLPEVAFTVYVVAEPSAVKVIFCDPDPAFATVGVASAPDGVTSGLDASEITDASLPPEAVTLKAYPVPFVSPVTVQLCVVFAAGVPVTVQNCEPPVEA